MILHLEDSLNVGDVQEHFSESFPCLKIEFYNEAHHFKEGSSPDRCFSPDSKIGSIRKKHDPGNLEIMSWYTTGKVEKAFRENFGLNVQIFRKENEAWVQTTASDALTLQQQCDMARDINPPI